MMSSGTGHSSLGDDSGVNSLSAMEPSARIEQRDSVPTCDDLEPSPQPVFARAFIVFVLLWVGFEFASYAFTSPERDLDQITVAALRSVEDPLQMIGSETLTEIMRDFTALGGYAVLVTLIISFAFFLRYQQSPRHAAFFLATSVGGYVCSMLMKFMVGRVRPGGVPHLSHVETSSFPSSHSMMSMIIFVTMGLMLRCLSKDIRVRQLLILLPFGLTVLVGISRVFMGVHYPTDVLAGWTAGILWAWAAFTVRQRTQD